MVGVCCLVVLVAVDVVHQEAQHLLEGDVTTRERQPLQLRSGHRRTLLREVTLGIGTEHLDAHLHVVKVLVILRTGVGVRADGITKMCKLSGGKVNPLIGSAGVSAVPMAARVSQKVGAEADPTNFLLMHAMGPNVAGVIGTAVAAGTFMAIFGVM